LKKLIIALLFVTLLTAGCEKSLLDPKEPVTVTVWHYYNGAILNAFSTMTTEFNDTVGQELGIIVDGATHAYGNVGELEAAVLSAARKEAGSPDLPNIFASYADTAYEAERMGLLANLDDYFTEEEQGRYLSSFIEEGRIGLGGELRIIPTAKSTEIMMINDTDWAPFAAATGAAYDDLSTMEGVARAAKQYYEWSGGKSFFGRDVMANFFIIASKQFGVEIFRVENGQLSLNIDEAVMRKIWDSYYIPYISGHFSSYGRFRSDDTKTGDILCYVGSTSSAGYFPAEVTTGGETYPVTAKLMPAPLFEGGQRVMVQQGAGMVVTKSTPQEEYASVVFLKWFTEASRNIRFSSLSGYMPVEKDALDYDAIKTQIAGTDINLNTITDETLRIAIEEINSSEMYTNKAFEGGVAARAVLENHLQNKALADREAVLALIEGGTPEADAVAQFTGDGAFDAWLADFTQAMQNAVSAG
jgi:multiple sugar transport system substrate-binding protein